LSSLISFSKAKKGQELSLSTIIILILALLVLTIIIIYFIKNTSLFTSFLKGRTDIISSLVNDTQQIKP